MANIPTKQDIKNRLRDEALGVSQRANLNVGGKGESEVLPTVEDLGLPLAKRRELEGLVNHHVELGKVERQAATDKKNITARIKTFIRDFIGDETPKFYVSVNKVSSYVQQRHSFNKDLARDTLLNLGVNPKHIAKAWDAATTVTPTETLRITAPGGEDES